MTDEHEHAMKVWREADRAGEDAYVEAVETGTTAVEAHEAGNQAATAVIAADRAGLVAEVERLRGALEVCAAELYAPDPACSCHIHPPCGDCTDYGSIREAIDFARTALGASHDQ